MDPLFLYSMIYSENKLAYIIHCLFFEIYILTYGYTVNGIYLLVLKKERKKRIEYLIYCLR